MKSLSSDSRVVQCGQSDMTKLLIAYRNIANAPKNGSIRAQTCEERNKVTS